MKEALLALLFVLFIVSFVKFDIAIFKFLIAVSIIGFIAVLVLL